MGDNPTYSASQAADLIGTDPKTLRRFLRENGSYHNPGSGSRYVFKPSDVEPLSKSFKAWSGSRRTKQMSGKNAQSKDPVVDSKSRATERVDALEASLKKRGVHISQHDDQIMRPAMMIPESEPTGYDLVEFCEVCGEPCDNDTGMFYDPESNVHTDEDPAMVFVAHADCGLNKGWSLA